jgi:two-component system cell cycle response regulator
MAPETRTILVVEDNPLNLKLVTSILGILNFRFITAGDAENALRICRAQRPDLVLMDVELPGMDGLSATRLLKSDPELRAIPVIALSAYAMPEDFTRAREAGCLAYLTKPIDKKSLTRTLNHLFGEVPAPGRAFQDSGHCHCILIVDDDPLNLKLLAAALSSSRYDIRQSSGGAEAVKLAREILPDLILLDVMMPEMDGFEVTTRLKADARTQEIPIILVTALDSPEDKRRGREAGADEFLNKPVNESELKTRVRSLLRLRTYQEQFSSRNDSRRLLVAQDAAAAVPAADDLPALLIVEDDAADRRLIRDNLEGLPCRSLAVSTGRQALETMARERIDVLLLDVLLPEMDGFELCRRLKADAATYPVQVIMITNLDDLENRLRGLELGADEYLGKPVNREELRARVKAAFRKKAYCDLLSRQADRAMSAAVTDGLTGLFNRAYLHRFLEIEIKRSTSRNHPLSLLMIDVDDFKHCNDTFGHPFGDLVLQRIAAVIQGNIREVDFAARFGGEEFSVVLPYTDQDTARSVAERLREKIAEPQGLEPGGGKAVCFSVSIGIATFPGDGTTRGALLEQADAALYEAKHSGKNSVVTASGLEKRSAWKC